MHINKAILKTCERMVVCVVIVIVMATSAISCSAIEKFTGPNNESPAIAEENAIAKKATSTWEIGKTNPSDVKAYKVGNSAFRNCLSLTSVTIPDSVTAIGDSAFSGCSSFTSVSIPDSVTAIGKNAFSGCSSLTEVAIPNSVTSIGEDAFSSCSSLRALTFDHAAADTLTIANPAFSYYNYPPNLLTTIIHHGNSAVTDYAWAEDARAATFVLAS